VNCPACAKNLKEVNQSDLKVDVCDQHCGGIWFDNFELKKVDEAHESLGEALLDMSPHTPMRINHEGKRLCPRCANQPLARHFFTVRQEIEVDDCPACGGIWLDVGELSSIRKQFKTEADRKKAAEEYFEKMFSKELSAAATQREASLEKVQKFARAVRFICPSYWMAGKQPWGAF
jgi:uncharacterized protein